MPQGVVLTGEGGEAPGPLDRMSVFLGVAAGLAVGWALLASLYLDAGSTAGHAAGVDHDHLLRSNVRMPVLALYLLVVHPVLQHLYRVAIASIARVRPVEGAGPAGSNPTSRAGELVALGVGAGIGLLAHASWILEPPSSGWMLAFHIVGTAGLYALAGRLLYLGVAGSARLNREVRAAVRYDVLDPQPLEPIAGWGLGITAAIVGGTTVSLVFDLWDGGLVLNPLVVLVYVVLVTVAVGLFFVNTWGAHRLMQTAKQRALAQVRRGIRAAYDDVEHRAAERAPAEDGSPASFLGNWLDLERRLVAAPSWPFTSDTLRKLGATVLLPLALYLVQLGLARVLGG
jgi:hypothetical protein